MFPHTPSTSTFCRAAQVVDLSDGAPLKRVTDLATQVVPCFCSSSVHATSQPVVAMHSVPMVKSPSQPSAVFIRGYLFYSCYRLTPRAFPADATSGAVPGIRPQARGEDSS